MALRKCARLAASSSDTMIRPEGMRRDEQRFTKSDVRSGSRGARDGFRGGARHLRIGIRSLSYVG